MTRWTFSAETRHTIYVDRRYFRIFRVYHTRIFQSVKLTRKTSQQGCSNFDALSYGKCLQILKKGARLQRHLIYPIMPL